MSRAIGQPLAAGLLSALLFLSLAKGLAAGLLLSYLAPLPLMMAALGLGLTAASAASLAGLVAVAAVAGPVSAMPFAVTAVLPTLVVGRQALHWRVSGTGPDEIEWYPPGLILVWLTGTVAVLIMLGAALAPAHEAGIKGWVAEMVGRTLELVAPLRPEGERRMAAELWASVFPSMAAGSWVLMTVVNAVTAQGLLVRLGHNRRPTPAYRGLELPGGLGVALVLCGVVGVVAEGDLGYVAANLAGVASLPFAFLGLATVHRWVEGRPNARLMLAVFYGVLFVAFGFAAVAVTGLGMVKFLTRFRRRGDSDGGKEG